MRLQESNPLFACRGTPGQHTCPLGWKEPQDVLPTQGPKEQGPPSLLGVWLLAAKETMLPIYTPSRKESLQPEYWTHSIVNSGSAHALTTLLQLTHLSTQIF